MWRMAGLVAQDAGVRDTVGQLADNHDQVLLALVAVIATSIAALVFVIRSNTIAKGASSTIDEVNSAVNNVGPGRHSLYDMVENIKEDVQELKRDQEQFDSHGWETLPPDLNSAVNLTGTIRDLQNHHHTITEKLDTLINELRTHVEWEMKQKYYGDRE